MLSTNDGFFESPTSVSSTGPHRHHGYHRPAMVTKALPGTNIPIPQTNYGAGSDYQSHHRGDRRILSSLQVRGGPPRAPLTRWNSKTESDLFNDQGGMVSLNRRFLDDDMADVGIKRDARAHKLDPNIVSKDRTHRRQTNVITLQQQVSSSSNIIELQQLHTFDSQTYASFQQVKGTATHNHNVRKTPRIKRGVHRSNSRRQKQRIKRLERGTNDAGFGSEYDGQDVPEGECRSTAEENADQTPAWLDRPCNSNKCRKSRVVDMM